MYKFLVVDDDEIWRQQVIDCLPSDTWTIFQAKNGVEGVKVFGEHKDIDVILTDMNMPKMNGPEMIAKIRGLPGGNTPIIAIMSIHFRLLQTEDLSDFDVSFTISKPAEDDFFHSILQLLEKKAS